MIRTLQVVQHLRPGGLEKLVLNLVRFASSNHRVYIASLEETTTSAISAWPELAAFKKQLIFLNKPSGIHLHTAYQLRKLVNKLKITTVHSHHLGPLLYSRLALLGLSTTHIHTEHDSWHLEEPKQQTLTRWLLKNKHVELVADAPTIAKELHQRLGRPADHIINNGIDCHFYCIGDQADSRHDLALPQEQILIGCAGRLVTEKGIDTMLLALSSLPEHYHLVIAGDGEQLSNLKQLACRLQLKHRIHWLGYCKNMRSFYRAIDVFCMPSRHEGLPLALLEAQACGKPIVASNIGAIPDVAHPENSVLISPNDPVQLAHALEHVLTHKVNEKKTAHFIQHVADVRTMTAAYEALAK
ncbi:Putative glycosyltransferase [Photobacterium sp. SKA34]|uniref:glycosyltransferase n=1 Tax=Photobacterium sp. SKA34 TaxID=121723 RepID=UPI00006BC756|nr:glycosyltransferase [Photobacterium sp. SKA34]EAR53583.1 Putative glycosyltransferase [Photobacterium sp. SKA34]